MKPSVQRTTRFLARLVVPTLLLGVPPARGASPSVAYGPLPEHTADICQPRIDLPPRPAILLIHGGGWTGGDKRTLAPKCRWMATKGYTVLVINYRLADGTPDHAWPAALDDARLALRWLLAHAAMLGVDPGRIGVVGDSAGAQMAVFLGAKGKHGGVRCVVEESGPIDLLSAPSFTSVVDPAVFGAHPIDATYRLASPVFSLDRTSAPTMVVHGRSDPLVPFSQAEELLSVLRRKAVPAAMVAYDGSHVMQDTTDSERSRVLAAEMAFLDSYLAPDDGIGNRR